MYRIRFHGRGGQGMKTASRMLGTAFFLEGFEVQDAPRYGAKRRGAPIFAYVRAAPQAINERGVIRHPDLVIVADDTLLPIPAAGVLQGVDAETVILINSHDSPDTWRTRLNLSASIVILPVTEQVSDRAELPYVGAACTGAAARLLGVISAASLEQAIRDELNQRSEAVIERNVERALASYEAMAEHAGKVAEGTTRSASDYERPHWIDLPFEEARVSAPMIHGALTSEAMATGLWRTMRPVIDYERCNRCWWICSTLCPDGAVRVRDGTPEIDYDHCKGCMVCAAVCPSHAIQGIPEQEATRTEDER